MLTQLVLVPLVYVPLRGSGRTTFSDDRLSENAEKLADRASGGDDGAARPDGLRRRADRRGARLPRACCRARSPPASTTSSAWLVAAAWFAVIHFRPVEYPGLFVFGLVAGACLLVTDRLGMSMATHVAFNVTGLLLAVR